MMAAAAEAEAELKRAAEDIRTERINHLGTVFDAMDDDGSGSIDREEFLKAMTENEEVMETLAFLGLHEETTLFDTLDVDGNGEISSDEFFEGLLLIARGNEPCKAKDVAPTFLTCKSLQKKMNTFLDRMSASAEINPAKEVDPQGHAFKSALAVAPASAQSDLDVAAPSEFAQSELDVAAPRNLSNRVKTLETQVGSITGSVQTLETQVGSITDALRVMTDEIKALRQQVGNNQCQAEKNHRQLLRCLRDKNGIDPGALAL